MDCIFCKIGKKEVPSSFVFENEHVFVIRDIQPAAKKHFLVIPKTHVRSLEDAFETDSKGSALVSEMFKAANTVAKQEGLLPGGFRSVINTNDHGGQTVHHLHLHILGGEKLKASFA